MIRYSISIIAVCSTALFFHAHAANSAAEQWVDSVNGGFTNDFKGSEPTIVPNYEDGVTYSDNPDTIKSEALKESKTNDGAQLIYSLGRKPDISGEDWFQNASDITENPSSVIDMGDGGYTDCEEVTTPGDSYSTTESCTQTVVPESRTCSYGPEIEVDSHYLYECKKERDTTDQTCNVGRVIDVTQSHKYGCNVGEDFYDKTCERKLTVAVTNNSTSSCQYSMEGHTRVILGAGTTWLACNIVIKWNGSIVAQDGYSPGNCTTSAITMSSVKQKLSANGLTYSGRTQTTQGVIYWELCKNISAPPTIEDSWNTTCNAK